MTFLDSSVIIDMLAGDPEIVAAVEARGQSYFTSSATARSTGDELVVADADFETVLLTELMEVTNLRKGG